MMELYQNKELQQNKELDQNNELQQTQRAFDTLYENVIGLYTKGILVQYRIPDELAAGIVSDLTGQPVEKLKELKNARYENVRSSALNAETANGINGPVGIVEHTVKKS